jgi:hypothetical protein
MPMPNSVPQTDQTSVIAIRTRNRAEIAKADAISNVEDRLQVLVALATNCVIHPKVVHEHAERIVEAVMALTKGTE